MPFQKGIKKKGGRQKGSVNKKTLEIINRAENVLSIIDSTHLASDIKKMSPTARMQLYLGCMEFVSPKLRRVDSHVKATVNLAKEPIVFS